MTGVQTCALPISCITFNLYYYCLIVLLLPTLCPFSLYGGLHNGQNCCNVYFMVKFHYYFPPLVMMSWKEDSLCFLLKSWFPKIPRILCIYIKLVPKDSKDFVYIYIYKLNNIYVGKNEVYLIISLNKKIIIIKKGRSRR